MRILGLLLALLLVGIQYPLWFGSGGWMRVWELERQLGTQRAANAAVAGRNQALAAEVQSLRDGREAIEERARKDLNMVREDEFLFHLVDRAGKAVGGAAAPAEAAETK